jgi:hypothetical protein
MFELDRHPSTSLRMTAQIWYVQDDISSRLQVFSVNKSLVIRYCKRAQSRGRWKGLVFSCLVRLSLYPGSNT